MGWVEKVKELHLGMNTPYQRTPSDEVEVEVDGEWVSTWPEVDRMTRGLNRDELIELLRKRNPKRWARLQADFEWAKLAMARMGRNPEDARFLL